MHHGARSPGLLDQVFLSCLLCIPPSPISQSKNQPSGQGLYITIFLKVCLLWFYHIESWQWHWLSSCSILSKYGVHGFPTLFLLNSTMRVRYHGSRTFGSLVAFYSDVTGKAFTFVICCGLLFWIPISNSLCLQWINTASCRLEPFIMLLKLCLDMLKMWCFKLSMSKIISIFSIDYCFQI